MAQIAQLQRNALIASALQKQQPASAVPQTHLQPKPSATNMQLLGNLNPEKKTTQERKAEVHESPVLARLCELFNYSAENYLALKPHADGWLQEHLKGIAYTKADFTHFVTILAMFQNEPDFELVSSHFLGVLANCGKDDEYLFITSHFEKKPSIGYQLDGKRLVVEGDAGFCLGGFMRKGEIIVKGNVVGALPWIAMEGGEITVEGDLRALIEDAPNGGIVRVNGKLPAPDPTNTHFSSSPSTLKYLFFSGRKDYSVLRAIGDAAYAIKRRFSSRGKIFHREKLVFDSGFHGIQLYVRHPLMALQGKLEMW